MDMPLSLPPFLGTKNEEWGEEEEEKEDEPPVHLAAGLSTPYAHMDLWDLLEFLNFFMDQTQNSIQISNAI
jgi:hypothetical protein